jgi:ATP adenylyltransferase
MYYRSRKNEMAYRKWRAENPHSDDSCVFCKRQEWEIVEESDLTLVVRSNHPYDLWEFRDVQEHLLVVPKRHVESLADLSAEEQVDNMNILGRYELDGYDIYARGDGSLTRTQAHQHTHLIKTEKRAARFGMFAPRPYIVLRIKK